MLYRQATYSLTKTIPSDNKEDADVQGGSKDKADMQGINKEEDDRAGAFPPPVCPSPKISTLHLTTCINLDCCG